MALDIPLPQPYGQSLLRGMDVGSSILARVMAAKTAQQQADLQSKLAPYEIQSKQATAYQNILSAQQNLQQMNALRQMMGMPPIDAPNFSFNQMGGDVTGGSNNANAANQAPVPIPAANPTQQATQATQEAQPQPQPQQSGQQQKPNLFNMSTENLSPQQRMTRVTAAHKMLGFDKPETKMIDGSEYMISPFDKPIPIVKGPTEREKEFTKSDVKVTEDWQKDLSASAKENIAIQSNLKLFENPAFKAIKSNPYLLGKDMAFYKRLKNDPRGVVANQLSQNNAILNQAMLQGYKGAARQWESAIVDNGKTNDKDTMYGMIAKTENLMKMKDLLDKRKQVAIDLVRDEGLSPNKALKRAEELIDYEKEGKKIEKQMNEALKKGGIQYDRGGSGDVTKQSINDAANEALKKVGNDPEKIEKINARRQSLLSQAKY